MSTGIISTELQRLSKKILRLRLAQKLVNERYKKGEFKIPIHLAMGHETIAAAVDAVCDMGDLMLLTHRNVHYNFLRLPSVKALMNEYDLGEGSVSTVNRGSMNLDQPTRGIAYTSSILGNNLAVGSGAALANKIKNEGHLPFIIAGDGSIEEGAFYESLLFMKSTQSPALIIVENNGWSLATSIPERRCQIDIEKICDALAAPYYKLAGNNIIEYVQKLRNCKQEALKKNSPVLIEVELTTLGHWILKNEQHLNGKFVNYHAGPAPTVDVSEPFLIESSNEDPVFVTKGLFSQDEWLKLETEVRNEIAAELKL